MFGLTGLGLLGISWADVGPVNGGGGGGDGAVDSVEAIKVQVVGVRLRAEGFIDGRVAGGAFDGVNGTVTEEEKGSGELILIFL